MRREEFGDPVLGLDGIALPGDAIDPKLERFRRILYNFCLVALFSCGAAVE
jgi:hypothetical protein